jgi:sigma-B regulation protein RsbU (phosphoserine phosphatase)
MFGIFRKREAQGGSTADARSPTVLQEEIDKLRRTVQQLSLLNDLAQAIGLSESSEEMIQAIVRRAKRALEVEQVMIYFVEQTGDEDVFKTMVRDRTVHVRRAFHFDEALRSMMEYHREPFLTNDPHNESRLQGVEIDPDLRSLLCVPLMVRGKLTGLVAACNKAGSEGFGEEEQRLLSIMANQSAQILETTRLREEERAYERLHRDVQMARDIQTGLLPKTAPEVAGYDLAGCSVPAEMVGGDYFDYIPFEDGRLGVCLGDVSGKGVPASLLMANLQATLRGQARIHTSAAECVTWSNRLLYNSTASDKFVTLFYCILDPAAHALTYCNAGHERPLLLSCTAGRDCRQELEGGGPILGVIDDFVYTEGRVELEPGSLMLVYSDGLTDAVDTMDRPFGVERVVKVLQGLKEASAQEILDGLLAAVKKHCAGTPAFDDVTLIAIRRDA